MTHNNDERLAAWLADGPAHGPTANLERALHATRATRQRPAWLVSVRGGTIAAERTNASGQMTWIVVAVAALLSLLIGTLVVGGWLRPPPAPTVVLPSPVALPSQAPSAPPSVVAARTGLVAYTHVDVLEPGEGQCTGAGGFFSCSTSGLWVANADGTDAHELLVNAGRRPTTIAWSADGSRLLYHDDHLLWTDPSGFEQQAFPNESYCEVPCSGVEGFALSPDGARLGFVRYSLDVEASSVVAIMDLATGVVTELELTRATNPAVAPPCNVAACQGQNESPRWSPDGTRLVFARHGIGPSDENGFTRSTVFTVRADGSDLRQIVPMELDALDPEWSLDGLRIVFVSAIALPSDDPEAFPQNLDIYVVSADGSGLRRLTSDGVSIRPNWTSDGRVVFARSLRDAQNREIFELWIMDADGGNARQLDADSLAELTAVGCLTCPYPLPDADTGPLNDAVWQPAP